MDSTPATTTPRICIVYTGGTMGSKPDTDGLLAPAPLMAFEQRVHELNAAVWPVQLGFRQVAGPPIDSADASPADWLRVRDVLEGAWDDFDGFVVVHGTDTLPYVAAFLSFAIEHQDKPVVVTGSMKPIFEEGDAHANLKASVLVAASRTKGGAALDQVLVCFGGRILRGNRAAKVGSSYDAISTPRVHDLGSFDVEGKDIGLPRWNNGQPKRVVASGGVVRFPAIRMPRVVLLRLFPGITASLVRSICKDADGVVVEAYGSGTGPAAIRKCLAEMARDDKFVVVTTEVIWGEVSVGSYATDLVATNSPLIRGKKLLAEAAFAKLAYLLGSANRRAGGWRKWVRELMEDSIRGDNGDS